MAWCARHPFNPCPCFAAKEQAIRKRDVIHREDQNMTDKRAIQATAIPEHKAKSLYPEPFASLVKHRTRRRLGIISALPISGST